jgi:ABC-2 type transport system ATP-binding protein
MLDEPINGLDPSAIIEMRTIFKRLKDEFGITILISSHILKEMQDICDSIIFIKDGTLIGNLPIERQTNKYIITLFDERDKLKVCEQFDIDSNQVVAGNEVCVRGDMPVYNIVQRLVTNGVKIIGVCKAQTSIENLYRKYYGDKEND